MANGMEMMVKSLIKMLGLDPVKMELTIDEIRKSLSNAASDMATVRRQNTAIMAHLGIAEIIEERNNEHEKRDDHRHVGNSGNGPSGPDTIR